MGGALLSVSGLSLIGLLGCGAAAWAAGRLARRPGSAPLAPLIALAGLGASALLPFAWLALFGRP